MSEIAYRIKGVYKEKELEGKCCTCKNYNPLIIDFYKIKTKMARGNCKICKYKDGSEVYKQRTETCKKYERLVQK